MPSGCSPLPCLLPPRTGGWPGGSDGKESACNAGDLGWALGQKDPLEKLMGTLSSILAWRIPRTEEPGRLQSTGSQRVRHDWATITFIFTRIGVASALRSSWASQEHWISCLAALLRTAMWLRPDQKRPLLQALILLLTHQHPPPQSSSCPGSSQTYEELGFRVTRSEV